MNKDDRNPDNSDVRRPKIAALPQAVADRIAAGEVVERPAAVLKELIENAIDAQSDKITVVIKDSGRTLIKVVDNGMGMTDADLAIAIGRHATSKITRFEDLEALTTFGFRGEALPSIAAVSKLEIVSKPHDTDVGTIMKISGGKVDKCEPVSASAGTSISVSHLFYNVPARRKFLRTDPTEFKWIALVFKQFALAFPDISWEFYRGNDKLYDLPAGTPRERLSMIFGDDIAEELIEIDYNQKWMKVTGFISPPSLTQRNRDAQFLFLNKRPIFSAGLNQSVYTACEPYFVSGGHPVFVIFLVSSPDRFDINVHPAKKQVKFADEGGSRSAVWKAVRDAISGAKMPEEFTPPSNAELDAKRDEAEEPSAREAGVRNAPEHLKPYIPISKKYHAPSDPIMPFPPDKDRGEDAGGAFDLPPARPRSALSQASEDSKKEDELRKLEEKPELLQVFDTFIMAPLKTGIAFIDQHIAHERILYEQALKAMEQMPWTSQQLLFPVTISLSPEDANLIEEAMPLLNAMGFLIEPFGKYEFRIEATPSGIRVSDEEDMIKGILTEYLENSSTESDPRKRLAAGFACKAAIKANQRLKPEEMKQLIEELFQTEDPEFCPHGRPIYHVVSRKEIDKWFKR